MNKERKKITIGKRITTIACSFCLLLLTIIPILALTYKKPSTTPPPIYYGVDEATRVDLSLEQTKTYINANYPKFNFIFEDYVVSGIVGYYEPQTENLLSIQILANNSILPFIRLEINLIVSENFIFNDHDSYILNSNFIKTDEYTLNKVYKQNNFEENLKAYINYSTHKIYLEFNVDDSGILNDEFLQKFL